MISNTSKTLFLGLLLSTCSLLSLVEDTGSYRPEISRYDREPETDIKKALKATKEENREHSGVDDRNWEEQMKKEKRIHQELMDKHEQELARLKK